MEKLPRFSGYDRSIGITQWVRLEGTITDLDGADRTLIAPEIQAKVCGKAYNVSRSLHRNLAELCTSSMAKTNGNIKQYHTSLKVKRRLQ